MAFKLVYSIYSILYIYTDIYIYIYEWCFKKKIKQELLQA